MNPQTFWREWYATCPLKGSVSALADEGTSVALVALLDLGTGTVSAAVVGLAPTSRWAVSVTGQSMMIGMGQSSTVLIILPDL